MGNRYKIMVVDDIYENLQLLTDILDSSIYEVAAFSNPVTAASEAADLMPDLILLDINMPQMDGYDLCRLIKKDEITRQIPVVFISALSEAFDKVRAFNAGGLDYITKPFHIDELNARIQTHIQIRKLQAKLEISNIDLKKTIDEQLEEIAAAQISTIIAIVKLAEARDDETGQHIERTRTFCRLLAEQLGKSGKYSKIIDDTFVSTIYVSSPLHDVGKIAISDMILRKAGKLTYDEFEIMKQHTIYGMETLSKVHDEYPQNSFINMGIKIAWYHHERWDGKGYPTGLAGYEIPIEARIMAVADVYDALRSRRSYKEAFSHEVSRDIIFEESGKRFDPDIVEAFSELDFEKNYSLISSVR
ncbi:MAG: response regulator [Spirochaetes bacterium]|nr:response regulator [Spirochaetota bacterium]